MDKMLGEREKICLLINNLGNQVYYVNVAALAVPEQPSLNQRSKVFIRLQTPIETWPTGRASAKLNFEGSHFKLWPNIIGRVSDPLNRKRPKSGSRQRQAGIQQSRISSMETIQNLPAVLKLALFQRLENNL